MEDVALVAGTQQNLSNLYSIDIYGGMPVLLACSQLMSFLPYPRHFFALGTVYLISLQTLPLGSLIVMGPLKCNFYLSFHLRKWIFFIRNYFFLSFFDSSAKLVLASFVRKCQG